MAAAFLKGEAAPVELPGMMALERIAERLEGERVPIPGMG